MLDPSDAVGLEGRIADAPVSPPLAASPPTAGEKRTGRRPLRLRGWAKTLSQPTAELVVGLMKGNIDAVRMAIEGGADVNVRNPDRFNTTALHMAALHPDPDFLLLLLQHSPVKPDLSPNDSGQTAFHACARVSNSAVTLPLLLLVYGSSASAAVDMHGRTYMHELMDNKVLPLSLLCHTAEHMLLNGHAARFLNQRDRFTRTVLDVAVERVTSTEEASLHLLLLRFGARRGLDMDDTRREHTTQDERRHRQQIGAEEEIGRKRIYDGLKTHLEELEAVVRRRRQLERLTEREALGRHEVQQERQSESAALQILFKRERQAVLRMSNVLREDRAATIIQCKWRQCSARAIAEQRRITRVHLHRAAKVIQAAWAVFWARRHSQRTQKENTAAILLQRWYQSRRARIRFLDRMLQRRSAAIRIWVAYRRYRNQARLAAKEEEKTLQIAEWSAATFSALVREVERVQSIFRMHRARVRYNVDRRAVVVLQTLWKDRMHSREVRRARVRCIAIDQIHDALRKRQAMAVLRTHLDGITQIAVRKKTERTMVLLTSYLWRNVFMDLFRRVWRKGRAWWWPSSAARHAGALPALHVVSSTKRARSVLDRMMLLADIALMVVLAGWSCTFAVWPRGPGFMPTDTASFTFWWIFDLVVLCVLFVLVLPSAGRWIGLQLALILASGAGVIAGGQAESRLVALGLLLKFPFVIRRVVPTHLNTETFCSCADLVGQWLLRLAPASIAVLVGCIRGVQAPTDLLGPNSNLAAVARVFLKPSSSVLASYVGFGAANNSNATSMPLSVVPNVTEASSLAIRILQSAVGASTFSVDVVQLGGSTFLFPTEEYVALNFTSNSSSPWRVLEDASNQTAVTVDGVVRASLPILPIALVWVAVWTHIILAVVLGVAQGMHKGLSERMASSAHGILSVNDRRKLRRKRSDVDRAAIVDAVGWDDDISTAKAAIEGSHFDHRLGLAHHSGSAAPIDVRAASLDGTFTSITDVLPEAALSNSSRAGINQCELHWDLRNESPELRAQYDAQLIQTALSGGVAAASRGSSLESFIFAQWHDAAFKRYSHLVVTAMVACSIAFPGLYWMELSFSVLLFVELAYSVRHLGVVCVMSSRWGFSLAVRLFSIIVGFVPQARPLTALRGVRLLEGWYPLLPITLAHSWCCLYVIYMAVVLWGIGLLSLSQSRSHRGPSSNWTAPLSHTTDGPFYCTDAGDCVATFTKVFLLPSGGPSQSDHIGPEHMTYVAAASIVAFRMIVVPSFLAFLLHSTLGSLSAPVRFLRLLVLRIHADVVRCWKTVMVECPEWFEHRRISCTSASMTAPTPPHRGRRRSSGGPRPPVSSGGVVVSTPNTTNLPPPHNRRSPNDTSALIPVDSARLSHAVVGKLLHWAEMAKRRSGPRNVGIRLRALSSQNCTPSNQLLLQRSAYASLEDNLRSDELHRDTMSSFGMCLRASRRVHMIHVANTCFTVASVVFLWVNVDATPGPPARVVDGPLSARDFHRGNVASVAAVAFSLTQLCVHGVSILLNIVLMPTDSTQLLTLLGCGGLAVSEVAYHAWGLPVSTTVWPLRFVNILRLAQLFWPHNVFGHVQRGADQLLCGAATRSVIPLVFLACVCALVVDGLTAMYSEMAMRREHLSSVQESARSRFYALIAEHHSAFFMSVFHYYLLPAIGILHTYHVGFSTVAYSTQADAIAQYPLLHDDPLVASCPLGFQSSAYVLAVCHYLRSVLLVAFCCVWSALFSFRSNFGTADNQKTYWLVELSCCAALAFLATADLASSVRRFLASWTDRFGSTVFSSRHGHAVTIGDVTLRQRMLSDLCCAAVWAAALGYWGLSLAAAVLHFNAADTATSHSIFVSAAAYDQYFVPTRSVWLLVLLPRSVWRLGVLPQARYVTGVVAAAAAIICGCAASVVFLRRDNGIGFCGRSAPYSQCVGRALEFLVRLTFTSVITVPTSAVTPSSPFPSSLPYLYSDIAPAELLGHSDVVTTSAFVFSIALKIILAVLSGSLLGRIVTCLRSCPPNWEDLTELPVQAARLHEALKGGLEGIVQASRCKAHRPAGATTPLLVHHKPTPNADVVAAMEEAIRHRFYAVTTRGILGTHREGGVPRYLVRQLLEECGVVHPAWERRRLHALLELLTCLPIMRRRESQCAAYVMAFESYRSGGPDAVPFSSIASYRSEGSHHANDGVAARPPRSLRRPESQRWSAATSQREASYVHRHNTAGRTVENLVSPSRLVEAVAWCEAGFPIGSSIDSMKWLDFMVLQQQVRGALALQSLWRMHLSIQRWEAHASRSHRTMALMLRRRMRRHQCCRRAAFFSAENINAALEAAGPTYSSSYFHTHVANQLRGRLVFDLIDSAKRTVQLPPAPTLGGNESPYASQVVARRRRNASQGVHSSSPSPRASGAVPGGFSVHPAMQRRAQHASSSASWQNRRYAGVPETTIDSASAVSRPQSPVIASRVSQESSNTSDSSASHDRSPSPSTSTSSTHSSTGEGTVPSPSSRGAAVTQSHGNGSSNATTRCPETESGHSPVYSHTATATAPPRPPSEPRGGPGYVLES